MVLLFRLLCGPGIKYAAFIQESGQIYGCSVQLSLLSLSHSYIINSNSPILALSSSASLQFTDDPPLPQQFSLLNKLPIFTLHGVENLGLAADWIHPELPSVSQT